MQKGQVSVFVILGFVILVFIALIVLFTTNLFVLKTHQAINAQEKLDEVQIYVEDCLEQHLLVGLQEVGIEGISTYLRKINCEELLDYEDDSYKIIAEEGIAQTHVTNESVLVSLTYPITIVGINTTARSSPKTYTYLLEQTYDLPVSNKRLSKKVELKSLGDLAEVILTRGSGINTNELSLRISEINQSLYVSLSQFNVSKEGELWIYSLTGEEGNYGIVDARTGRTLETRREGNYFVAKINSGGAYFVGSCEEYVCCWNDICDTSETPNTCNECRIVNETRSGIGDLFGDGSNSGGNTSGNSEIILPSESGSNPPAETPPKEEPVSPPPSSGGEPKCTPEEIARGDCPF